MATATHFYDALSADYDLFVDWPARLAYELPWLERQLRVAGAHEVLDVACGTGQHAMALAERGFDVTGVDFSPAMITRARERAAERGVDARFEVLGFGGLSAGLARRYDALLCLGNSIPHMTDSDSLAAGLADFGRVLRTGGLLVLQQRNFDRVLARQERYMPPQSAIRGDDEWLFVRFYDMDGADLRFNLLRFHRRGGASWEWRAEETRLRAWRHAELTAALQAAGFSDEQSAGNLAGDPFDRVASGDLVFCAKRP